MDGQILKYALAAAAVLLIAYFAFTVLYNPFPPAEKRVVVLGFDGMDARLAEKWMDEGKLPNLARLRSTGTYSRIQTTTPADTPVAWTTVATGLNPGKHNVLDFLDRDPQTYMPRLAVVKKEEVEGQVPKVYNTKNGTSIWKTVEEGGGWSTVLAVPVTFPAEDFRGKMISGLGTPDIRGTWGTFTIYSENSSLSETEMGGNFVPISFEGNSADAKLYGPKNYTQEMGIRREGDSVILSIGGKEYKMREGEWSGWADIQFEVMPLVKVKGIGRFYLVDADPLYLYLMPVSMDPRDPFFRVSTPEGYSEEVASEYGLYKTVGWADDTWAINDEAIEEEVFLQDAYRTLDFRERLFLEEMGKKPSLLFAVFYQTDTIQHTFYRYMDPENPNYKNIPKEEREKYEGEILRAYQRMDSIVGKVLEKADEGTTVIVMSDHGFNPFRYSVNLNTWLAQEGYLKKKPGADTRFYMMGSLYGEKGLFWNDVLLNESRAYSMGLGNIYINLKGREAQGTVSPEDYGKVCDEIILKLKNLRDPKTGEKIIANAQKREDLYRGPYENNSADIIVSFNPGYRVSWQTSLGGVPPEVAEPNMRKWSGDHCTLDPRQTEGVFFSNRIIKLEREPSLLDINPTIRDLLSLPQDDYLDGSSLISPATAGAEALPGKENPRVEIPSFKGYNVLLITIDCTRADYISAYNNESPARTENIDSLASRSFLFENAFTAFTFTCPSHTIMLSGMYFGQNKKATAQSQAFLNALNASNYSTGASVGFGGLKPGSCKISESFPEVDVSSIKESPGVRGEVSANYTIDWIRGHKKDKFFFWLHLYDSHPPGVRGLGNSTNGYANGVEFVDSQVGRVLQALRDEGLENRTIVVLVADHGMGDDFKSIPDNRKLYEDAIHVPYIIHIPGYGNTGERIQSLASTVDIAPTLAELLNLSYPDAQGVSLLPAMEGGEEVRSEVFSTYEFSGLSQDMVRTREWKLINSTPKHSNVENCTYELFNVEEDPEEQHNEYSQESGIAEELGSLLGFYDNMGKRTLPAAPSAPAAGAAGSAPYWYGSGGAPLDNETLNDLRSFGYIN